MSGHGTTRKKLIAGTRYGLVRSSDSAREAGDVSCDRQSGADYCHANHADRSRRASCSAITRSPTFYPKGRRDR